MATAGDTSPLRDLIAKLTALDNSYEVCSTLYKQVNEILENGELDELTIAILQQYKLGNQETPFRIQVSDKWKQLKRTRSELKLAVCGDVAAGKSSFVNFLMGGNFLPFVQGSCTQVVCEVCHAERRSVDISYVDRNNQLQVQTEILGKEPGSENWKWLGNVIEEGYLLCDETTDKMAVKSVRIYWPLDIFQDTDLKTLENRQDINEHISVVFCDFPGLDNKPNTDGSFPSFIPIQSAVENKDVDGFLFVINNQAYHGITFTMNENVLTTQLYKHIEKVKRRKIEEYWLWLIDLCEASNGLLVYKNNWRKAEQTIVEIREKAAKDKEFLQQAKNKLEKKGKLEIKNKLIEHKQSLESHLLNRLQKYCDTRDFKRHEEQFILDLNMALTDYKDNFKEFEEFINDWRDQQRDKILKKSWLLDLFQNTPNKKSFKYDSLVYVPLILLFPVVFPIIPFVKMYLVGRTIVDDVQESFFSNAKQKIQHQVNRLDDYVDNVIHDLIERINRQIDILQTIDGEIASNKKTLNQIRKITDSLMKIFITDIAKHDINLDEVCVEEVIGQGIHTVHGVTYRGEIMAQKKIQTRILIRPTDDAHDAFRETNTVSAQVLLCRELLLLRKLSGLHTDPDFKHLVQFKGSAIGTDCQYYTLYLFMERGENNLAMYLRQVGQTLSSKKRIDIMIGAAKGLRILHNNNILHRDIKLENFLMRDGIVKLCDFDHSKEDDKIVSEGQARGTRKYHPPEISNFNHLHTEKSDIFCFGFVIKGLWDENRGQQSNFQRRDVPITNLVKHCQHDQPHRRPDIGSIIMSLKAIMDS